MGRRSKVIDRLSPFKKASAAIGVIATLIGVVLGGRQIISQVQESRETREKVQIYLSSGDRFAEQGQYDEANKQYEKALEIDKNNVDARRGIIRASREQLTRKAFPPGNPALDIGLRHDYPTSYASTYETVTDEQINGVLARIYELRTLNPKLKDDVDLQLDEALILKTNGKRLTDAIKVLDSAHQLAPENPGVNAELGLMLAVPEESQRKAEGIALIRRAVQSGPNQALYHYYLGQALAEIYACPYAGLENNDPNGPQACAEAVREYHRAADLAASQDIWSPAIRDWAHRHSMDIFHRYARKEGDILTAKLAMPADERLREIAYLAPTGASTSHNGIEDDPHFWIAQLEFATGDADKADQQIRDIMHKDHDGWLGSGQKYWEDATYLQNRTPYVQFFVKVLKKTGHDPQMLTRIESIIRLPAKPD